MWGDILGAGRLRDLTSNSNIFSCCKYKSIFSNISEVKYIFVIDINYSYYYFKRLYFV